MDGLTNLYYTEQVRPQLIDHFQFSNEMQAPPLSKVVINIGMGEALDNAKSLDFAVEDITLIIGQRPVITNA